MSALEEEGVSKRRLRPLLITNEACALHHIRHHPEQPRRVLRIESAVLAAYDTLCEHDREARCATELELQMFHTAEHVAHILKLCRSTEEAAKNLFLVGKKSRKTVMNIDDDTAVMHNTREAALRAAGATLVAVDAVMEGAASSAFACVRPPGHHATPTTAMGFCLFNNVGVAVHHARVKHGVRKVAVVDVDVHHGNGTEAGFLNDPNTLYASFHQYGQGFYPETGGKTPSKNVINCPLRQGDGSEVVRRVFEARILPALLAFEPELIFMSLGFDGLAADPIGGLKLVAEDYAWMTKRLCEVQSRLVSVLEGGYDLDAISSAAVAHVGALIADAAHPDAARPERPATQGEAVAAPEKKSELVWENHIESGEEENSSGTEWGSGEYSDSAPSSPDVEALLGDEMAKLALAAVEEGAGSLGEAEKTAPDRPPPPP